MDSRNPIMAVVIGGVALAVLWVMIWALLIPLVLPNLTWPGYDGEAVLMVVFLVGCVGGGWYWIKANR